MADTYEILSKQSNVMVSIRKENDRPTIQPWRSRPPPRPIEMEDFYYSAIYSVLQDTTTQTTPAVALKKTKGKDSKTQQ